MRFVIEQPERDRRGKRSSPNGGHSSRRDIVDSSRTTSRIKSRTPERVVKRSTRSSSSNVKKVQERESRKESYAKGSTRKAGNQHAHDSQSSKAMMVGRKRSIKETLSSTVAVVRDRNRYSPAELSPQQQQQQRGHQEKRSVTIGKLADNRGGARTSGRHNSPSLSPPAPKKSRKTRNISSDDGGKSRNKLERSGSIPRFKEMLATPPRTMEGHGGGGNMERTMFRKDVRNYDGSDQAGATSSATATMTHKMYTKEELKTITVDIFRPMKDSASLGRSNINPKDVVLVRRPTEGQRPIFDRDEIRQALAERSDSDFIERRVVAVVKERSRSPRPSLRTENFGPDRRENFQVNSGVVQSHQQQRDQMSDNVRPSLNDRWQKLEPRNADYNEDDIRKRKEFMDGPPRGPGSEGYGNNPDFNYGLRGPSPPPPPPPPRRSMSPGFRGHPNQYSPPPDQQQHDRYFSNENRQDQGDRRMMYGSPERNYGGDSFNNDVQPMMMMPRDPEDLRHNLSKRRQSMEPPQHYRGNSVEERHNFNERGGTGGRNRRSRSFDRMERGGPDERGNRDFNRDGRHQGHRSDYRNPDNFNQQQQQHHGRQDNSEGRSRGQQQQEESLPNFSSRPDKYRYNEWMVKPDMVPKGSSYFEHDNRDNRGGFVRGSRGGRGFFPRGRGGFFQRGKGRVSGSGSGSGNGRGGGFTGNHGGFNGGSSRDNRESREGRESDFRGRGEFQSRHQHQSSSYSTRSKRSPNHWKHDMFQFSPERDTNKLGRAS